LKNIFLQGLIKRGDKGAVAAYPVCDGAVGYIEAMTAEPLLLTVQWQVVHIFINNDLFQMTSASYSLWK
jgi:hypothetical protein